MPYTIKKSDGETVVVIPDGAIDEASTSLSLVGKNVSGYGFYQNENFVKLLESFSKDTPPAEPLEGQIWYDSLNKQLKVYTNYLDGSTLRHYWKGVSNNTVSDTQPPVADAAIGDLWYDTNVNQLKAFNGTAFDLIETSVPGFGKSRLEGATIAGIVVGDIVETDNPVLNLYIDAQLIAIISKYEFNPSNPVAGLHDHSTEPGRIFAGVNLVGAILNGVVDQANNFVDPTDGPLDTSSFVRTDASFTQVVDNSIWAKDSFVVGNDNGQPLVTFSNYVGTDANPDTDLQINSSGERVVFTVNTDAGVKDIVMVDGAPQESGESSRISFAPVGTTQVDLGTPNRQFRNVWAQSVVGDLTGDVIGNLAGNVNGSYARLDTLLSRDGLTTVIDASLTIPEFTGKFIGNVEGNVSGASLALTGNAVIDGSLTVATISVTGGTADGMNISGGTVANSTLTGATINSSTLNEPVLINPTATTQSSDDSSTKIATTAFVHSILPTGIILMWSGQANNIPTGWLICDGATTDGFTTPDLTNKFVLGAGLQGPVPGTTGGSSTISGTTASGGDHNHSATIAGHALTEAQMPNHGHIFDDIRFAEVWNSPTYTYNDPMLGPISTGPAAGSSSGVDYDNGVYFTQHGTYKRGGGEAHTHNIVIDAESTHTHTLTIGNVKPPYYALCYIIKVI